LSRLVVIFGCNEYHGPERTYVDPVTCATALNHRIFPRIGAADLEIERWDLVSFPTNQRAGQRGV
jgi:hypothetical protein